MFPKPPLQIAPCCILLRKLLLNGGCHNNGGHQKREECCTTTEIQSGFSCFHLSVSVIPCFLHAENLRRWIMERACSARFCRVSL
jgi:hypothetical protein